MGNMVSELRSRRLTTVQLGDAREIVGANTFTDTELQHLFSIYCDAKGVGGVEGGIHRKQFQRFIFSLGLYPCAPKDEQFPALFRAFDRDGSGEAITWASFLRYHLAMKFGMMPLDPVGTDGKPGAVPVAPSQERPPSGDAPLPPAPFPTDDGVSSSNAAAVDVPLPFCDASITIVQRKKYRHLLGELLFDLLCDPPLLNRSQSVAPNSFGSALFVTATATLAQTAAAVSKEGLATAIRRSSRWLARDQDSLEDSAVASTVASIFRSAHVPNRTQSLNRNEFVAAFNAYDGFARRLLAIA